MGSVSSNFMVSLVYVRVKVSINLGNSRSYTSAVTLMVD